MTAAAILTGLSQFLGSAAGQRAVNEILDRLHPEKRIDAAIAGLPTLKPLPSEFGPVNLNEVPLDSISSRRTVLLDSLDKGDTMAEAKAVPTLTLRVLNAAGEPVAVGITWEEVLALLPRAVELFAAVKGAVSSRPPDEDGVVKATYGFEAGAPLLAAMVRQVMGDLKD